MMWYEEDTLRLNCITDSSCHQFAVFSNRWFFHRRPMSAWGRDSVTAVGEMAFRLSPKPGDKATHQGNKL